ncbi:MAG: CoA-disulfide reductase [Bacteroidetes Order II. Incertae sedis bacterium]|nr:CoA-disulfide reductase [Bacteroidetes Order II. bacterium]
MKILIVGGVAGGATAAARMRRLGEEHEIVLFERGGYVSFANCGLPYHIGEVIKDREKLLLQTPQSLKERYGLDVRIRQEVLAIDPENKNIQVKNLTTDEIYTESYDKLLLSPGAAPFVPPIPGIQSSKIFTLRNIHDMDKIIESARKAKHVVVVGGGFIGLEVAENLIEAGKAVTLVELSNQVMAPVDFEFARMVEGVAKSHGLSVKLNAGVTAFEESANGISVTLNSGETIETEGVVFAIGVRPENALARQAGLEIGQTGGIKVNAYLQTSQPDIYAVGDAIEVSHLVGDQKVLIPLAWPANRQGRIVADNMIQGHRFTFKGALGTSILKFFEYTVGATGLNEKTLKRWNIPYKTITVTRGNHAGYYPGSTNIVLKLIFSEKGALLGAQAFGKEGVDKRIDVISTAIKGKLTVHDLADIEVAYAPPYNSAKDPVNIAGYAAQNLLEGTLRTINVEDLPTFLKQDGVVLVDVRTAKEFDNGHIPDAINMELDTLRENISFFDPSKTYVLTCQVGLRGYLAHRILQHHGIASYSLNGGYGLWQVVNEGKIH